MISYHPVGSLNEWCYSSISQPRRTFGVSFPVLTTRAHPLTEEARPQPLQRPMSTTLADVLYPGAHAPGGEPQSPPSDLTPSSPAGSGSDDDGGTRKRSASGSIKENKERTANKICRVCGDKAYSYNFNVITCESCKAFFRRNANKEKEIRCPFNESCEINVVSRRFCQRCRLFKCFSVGMKKEWIMTDEARLEKKARVEENRERRREEAKRKDNGPAEVHHYRTTSVSSSNGTTSSSAKNSAAAAQAAAAAAAAAAAETASLLQHQQQQQQAFFQPELPTHAPSTSTLLDAIAQQVQQQQQQPLAVTPVLPQPFGSAAALVAAVVPPAPTNSELVAHAIAIEQQMQQTPFAATVVQQQPAAAAAAAVFQAAAAHQQQQQQMAAAAAVAQQIVSMTTPVTPAQIVDSAAVAAALALPPATPTTAATAAALLSGASPLGPLTQAALIMDASAAATQQLFAAAAPPPPSALAAVASTMLLPQQQLLQPAIVASGAVPRCCCTCNCGRYHGPRSIVDQAQEEWEVERRGRRSNSSAAFNDRGLAELLPSAGTTVSWLNPATNQNPLTDGALSISTMNLEDLSDLGPASRPPLDPEFGPMEADDEERLRIVHERNKEAWERPLSDEDAELHSVASPSTMEMLQMMVGAVKRMILMAKRFPELRKLHETDQLKLIRSCYLDVMIIRGAMSYDPSINGWKGPTPSHGYSMKMDAMNDLSDQNNMFQQSIRLYAMFKEEYRTEETIMLLLNMIVLFDPNAEGLTDVAAVRAQCNVYKRCLKRYMHTKLKDSNQCAQREYLGLLERLATVRKMNLGAQKIMEKHEGSMNPLLKELLSRDDNLSSAVASASASASAAGPVASCSSSISTEDQPPSASSVSSPP